MTKTLLILALLCSVNAHAEDKIQFKFDDWTPTNKVLLGTTLTALTLDWAQTRYIAKHPERFEEMNPLLGKHPSVSRVNKHFAATMLITAGVAHVMPSEYRNWFLGSFTVLELIVVGHNKSIGVGFSF